MSEKQIDLELIHQVLKGDREAFDILVLKYQRRIKSVVASRIDDQGAVLDITQETFIKAYNCLEQFHGNSSFYTWIYRIAVNTVLNYAKHKSRRPPGTDIDYVDAEFTQGKAHLKEYDNPEGILMCDEMQDRVLVALNNLPEELRVSIVLREMAGLSYEEIATAMNVPVGTVRSRIFRARSAVDTYIKPLLQDHE